MYQILYDAILRHLSRHAHDPEPLYRVRIEFEEGSGIISLCLPEIEAQLAKFSKVLGLDPGFSDFVVNPDLNKVNVFLVLKELLVKTSNARDEILIPCLEKFIESGYDVKSYSIKKIEEHNFLFSESFISAPTAGETAIENTTRVHTFRLEALVTQLTDAFSVVEYFFAMSQNMVQSNFHSDANYIKFLEAEAKNYISLNKDQLFKICRKVSELSLLPFAMTVRNLGKVIENICESQKKKVQFIPLTMDSYINGHLAEIIYPVLIHLVRNCVDHGIEEPEIRKTKGKDPEGKIILQAFNAEDGSFIVQLIDDGKGMDIEKIKAKAVSLNLIDEKSLKKLNDAEIMDFIFQTGFSTSEKVTTVSGRGLGMDIVKKNLQREKGSIRIHTEKNRGCHFLIKIPNFSPILQVVVFQVGQEFFGIDKANIVECYTSDTYPEELNKQPIGMFDEKNIYFDLTQIIFPHNLGKSTKKGERSFIQVDTFWGQFILLADKNLGDFVVAPKDPGNIFSDLETLSGVATLGDGSLISLIYLDTFIRRAWEKLKDNCQDEIVLEKMKKLKVHKIRQKEKVSAHGLE
ncbi:ATP-binding protein [Candidatus Riflebacteria bacterium]